jgi:3-deoxy-D-arabino-heptulosonate 7-phosphate (DAHP) synthase class II
VTAGVGGDEQHKDRYENTCHAAFIIVRSRRFRRAHDRLGTKTSQRMTLALAPNIHKEECIRYVSMLLI